MTSFGDFFQTLSQTASPQDFQSLWGNDPALSSSLVGYTSLQSLSAEATQMVEYVRLSLGEPIVLTEIDKLQIFMAFESANLKYSSIINAFQARSWFSSLLGMKVNYEQNDLVNKLPAPSFDGLMKLANPYAEQARPYVGSPSEELTRCYFQTTPGQEYYDIYHEGHVLPNDVYEEGNEYPKLIDYIQSVSATSVDIKTVLYFRDSAFGRFIDPYSSFMWLENFQSGYRNQTEAMHIMPIWGDILRMQMLSTSDQVRRAEMTYTIYGNKLRIIPQPRVGMRIYFECALHGAYGMTNVEPWQRSLTGDQSLSAMAISGSTSSQQFVTGLHNVPFKDIKYSEVNPIGRNWIREYTLASSMEILGRVRGKFASIDIPGQGSITLDGDKLVADGKEMQQKLIDWLNSYLEEMTQEKVIEKEAKKAQDLNTQLQFIPMGIYRV